MKTFFIIINVGLLCMSCGERESFSGASLYFETDKLEYCPGDTVKITAVIESKRDKKFKVYKNFRNLIFSVASKDTYNNENFGKGCAGMTVQNIGAKEKTKIEEFVISQGHPYKKTFIGYLGREKGFHTITVPELKHFALIKEDTTSESTIIGVVGQWHPTDRQVRIDEYHEGDIPIKEIRIKNGCQQKL